MYQSSLWMQNLMKSKNQRKNYLSSMLSCYCQKNCYLKRNYLKKYCWMSYYLKKNGQLKKNQLMSSQMKMYQHYSRKNLMQLSYQDLWIQILSYFPCSQQKKHYYFQKQVVTYLFDHRRMKIHTLQSIKPLALECSIENVFFSYYLPQFTDILLFLPFIDNKACPDPIKNSSDIIRTAID